MGGEEKDAAWISRGGFGFGQTYLGFSFFFLTCSHVSSLASTFSFISFSFILLHLLEK